MVARFLTKLPHTFTWLTLKVNTMTLLWLLMTNLFMVTTLSHAFLSHPSDDCLEGQMDTETHMRLNKPDWPYKKQIFCMGSKGDNISYGVKQGCMATADCDYIVSVKVVMYLNEPDDGTSFRDHERTHFQWNLFAKEGEMLFFVSKKDVDVLPYQLNDVTVVNTSIDWTNQDFASWTGFGGCFQTNRSSRVSAYCYEPDWAKTIGDDVEPVYERGAVFKVGNQTLRYNRVTLTTWNNMINKPYPNPWVPSPLLTKVVPVLIGVKYVAGQVLPLVSFITTKQTVWLLNIIPSNINTKVSQIFTDAFLIPVTTTTTTEATTTEEQSIGTEETTTIDNPIIRSDLPTKDTLAMKTIIGVVFVSTSFFVGFVYYLTRKPVETWDVSISKSVQFNVQK